MGAQCAAIVKGMRKNLFKDKKHSKNVNVLNHRHYKQFLVYFQIVLKAVFSLVKKYFRQKSIGERNKNSRDY